MDDGLLGRLNRWNGRVTLWLARAAAVALAAIATFTFCDVIARYVFNAPFTFTVEFTELSMALIVYLGVGLTTQDRGHIIVDVFTLQLPPRARIVLSLVMNVLSLAFLAVMIWMLWQRAAFVLSKGDKTQIWMVPYWPVAFVMGFGSLFLLTGTILQAAETFQRLANPATPPVSEAVPRPFTD